MIRFLVEGEEVDDLSESMEKEAGERHKKDKPSGQRKGVVYELKNGRKRGAISIGDTGLDAITRALGSEGYLNKAHEIASF